MMLSEKERGVLRAIAEILWRAVYTSLRDKLSVDIYSHILAWRGSGNHMVIGRLLKVKHHVMYYKSTVSRAYYTIDFILRRRKNEAC